MLRPGHPAARQPLLLPGTCTYFLDRSWNLFIPVCSACFFQPDPFCYYCSLMLRCSLNLIPFFMIWNYCTNMSLFQTWSIDWRHRQEKANATQNCVISHACLHLARDQGSICPKNSWAFGICTVVAFPLRSMGAAKQGGSNGIDMH